MKTSVKRLLSAVIAAALLCGGLVPALAAGEAQPTCAQRLLYDAGDFAIRAMGTALGLLFPAKIPSKYEQSPDFYPGMERFITAPEGDKAWSLGYARASLIPEGYFDPVTKEYIGGNDVYVGGGLVGDGQRALIDRKTPTKLLDDQCVRATALSDGSGRGIVAFASLDGFGLTSYDVREIRKLLRDFAKEKNLVSINIGVLHQHSVIDVLGMNGPLLEGIFLNPLANLTGWYPIFGGKNPAFMRHLHETVAKAVRDAVGDMRKGKLYYGKADAAPYIHDKREPIVFDPYLHRLRFRPNDGTKETWLVEYAAHCTGFGASTRAVSGDYPYYMEQRIGNKANFQMIQGAQLAITLDTSAIPEKPTSLERIQAYGYKLGDLLIGIGSNDTQLPAILNVRHREFRVPIDNPLHMLMFRLGILQSTSVKANCLGTKVDLVTEAGYMELGNTLAVVIAPGEIEPCLAMGGGLSAAEAWSGEDYEFTPMKDRTGGRALLVFGIMNDHAGYFILPNDIHNFVLFGNEEINAASTQAAKRLLEAFTELTK